MNSAQKDERRAALGSCADLSRFMANLMKISTLTLLPRESRSDAKAESISSRFKRALTFGFAAGLSALILGIAIQYGASIGAATGTTTAFLLIALGVLTEAGKALGFYSAAASLRSQSFLASVGWSVVALSCLAYSVTADLHVSDTSRGDATAKRSRSIQTLKDGRFDRSTAAIELRSIEPQASFTRRLEKLLDTPKANRCGVQSSSRKAVHTMDGELSQKPKTSVPVTAEHVPEHRDGNDDTPGSGAKANVITLLAQNGGRIQGGQRGLAARILLDLQSRIYCPA